MTEILLSPPAVLIIIFAVLVSMSHIFSRWAAPKTASGEEGQKAYSCGEEFSGHLIQPDYSQFFPFAFFFTILHVVAMVIATIPAEAAGSLVIALIYVVGAFIGLFILLGR